MRVGVSYLPNIGLVKHERWTLSGCTVKSNSKCHQGSWHLLSPPTGDWRPLHWWWHLNRNRLKSETFRHLISPDWHVEAVLALAADMGAEEWSEDGNSWALLHHTSAFHVIGPFHQRYLITSFFSGPGCTGHKLWLTWVTQRISSWPKTWMSDAFSTPTDPEHRCALGVLEEHRKYADKHLRILSGWDSTRLWTTLILKLSCIKWC